MRAAYERACHEYLFDLFALAPRIQVGDPEAIQIVRERAVAMKYYRFEEVKKEN